MKLTKKDIKAILSSIDILLDIKTYIRKISPLYELTDPYDKKIIKSLHTLQNELDPLFTTYLHNKEISISEFSEDNQKERIIDVLSEDNMALISSNSAKNILKDQGIDPRKLIVTGGPLFYEDYRKVNPNIPDHALKGIKKKCKGIMDSLEGRDWKNKDLYFIYEEENVADTYTFEKIDRLSDLIGKNIKIIKISSWDDF
ncbi:MAG: DUF2100 domain-containing protein [Promethearchaeota archaeon]|nr:MAG: DUF2100 domain-containing protein [Candidatus Lokiarchaeota archaeon]